MSTQACRHSPCLFVEGSLHFVHTTRGHDERKTEGRGWRAVAALAMTGQLPPNVSPGAGQVAESSCVALYVESNIVHTCTSKNAVRDCTVES